MSQNAGFVATVPIYKDQSVAANRGKLIEVGDTVSLVAKGATSTELITPTVTAVGKSGKAVFWNYGTTAYKGEDILRLHQKHIFEPDGAKRSWTIDVDENSSGASLAAAVSVILEGATYELTAAETGSPATGFTDDFMQDLEDEINAILLGDGVCTVEASGGTMTITISGTRLYPGTLVITNTTPDSTWTQV